MLAIGQALPEDLVFERQPLPTKTPVVRGAIELLQSCGEVA